MGTKTAVSFANIYVVDIETNLIQQLKVTPSQQNGSNKVIMFSPFGTVTEKMWNFLLKKLTISTLQ